MRLRSPRRSLPSPPNAAPYSPVASYSKSASGEAEAPLAVHRGKPTDQQEGWEKGIPDGTMLSAHELPVHTHGNEGVITGTDEHFRM